MTAVKANCKPIDVVGLLGASVAAAASSGASAGAASGSGASAAAGEAGAAGGLAGICGVASPGSPKRVALRDFLRERSSQRASARAAAGVSSPFPGSPVPLGPFSPGMPSSYNSRRVSKSPILVLKKGTPNTIPPLALALTPVCAPNGAGAGGSAKAYGLGVTPGSIPRLAFVNDENAGC